VIDGQDSRGVPRAAPPASAQEADATRLKGHVLVAEDNPINAVVIRALLGQLGITMALVGDGQQAVDAIIQGKPGGPYDLVLMDLHMPVMDGYSATEKIRQWEGQNARPSLPIIALTADAFEEDRQHCKAVGMDDFLTKPIALDALKAAMVQWLAQAPAEKPA